MLGSLVYAGGLDLESALSTVGIDGAVLGDELERIGWAGPEPVPGVVPHAFVELHIEQGPVLEQSGEVIGAVTGVQGISWQELTLTGQSNHAGTTPLALRHDAGLVAAQVAAFVRALALDIGPPMVGTVGRLQLHPDLVNVVAASAVLTADLRHTDDDTLRTAETRLRSRVAELAAVEGVSVDWRELARFAPVVFDPTVVSLVEAAAGRRGLPCRRMPSGAGHDAQMISRMCPTGMVFVPSRDGISHNPREYTSPDHLAAGASVLCDVLMDLAG
jgi:beta-ureidopropionase / N-carbamoyl-L-amino-acid hydrolase